jgi:hypothetical protein
MPIALLIREYIVEPPRLFVVVFNVADPDPGSGAFFYPWIRNPDPGSGMKKSKSRTRDPERTSRILFLRIIDQFFGLIILKFFYADPYPDPISGILSTVDPGSGI